MNRIVFFSLALFTFFNSFSAHADGFLCKSTEDDSPDLVAKLYDQVNPALGTRNPAVLVVASSKGTIAVVYGDDLTKTDRGPSVTLGGHTTRVSETEIGNVSFVGLTLQKKANIDGFFYGLLDLDEQTIGLVCQRYLKSSR
jgi:hypothetical protein